MRMLLLLWLSAIGSGMQGDAPLALDVRVFRGAAEVTKDTVVTLYPSGARTGGRTLPLVPGGERRVSLPAGQYDLQLLQQTDGRIAGVTWTSLRLLVDYPGEYQQHLEVFNFAPGWGAIQVRQGQTREREPIRWSATLKSANGSDVARSVTGHGYAVIVAPAGVYSIDVTRADGSRTTIPNVEVRENLTYLKTF